MYTKLFYAASLLKQSFRVKGATDKGLLRKRVDFASYVVEFCLFLNVLNVIPLLKICGAFEWVKEKEVWIIITLIPLTWVCSCFLFLYKDRGIALLSRMDEQYRNHVFPAQKIVWGTLIVSVLLVIALTVVAKVFF